MKIICEYFQVRDGLSHMSNLLLHHQGGSKPPEVRSSSNKMMIEFMSPAAPILDFTKDAEGFVAVFNTKGMDNNANHESLLFIEKQCSIRPKKMLGFYSWRQKI